MTVDSLAGGTVITLDAERRILEEATVVIENGRISDVVSGYQPHGVSIDCRGKLVLPGLVNAHAHTTEVLWRGCGGGLPTVDWIRERKHPLMTALDESGAAAGVRLACAEMALSGTTAFLDPEVPAGLLSAAATSAGASGLRAGLAATVASGAGYGGSGERESEHHHGHGHQSHHGVHGHHHDAVDPAGEGFREQVLRWHGSAEGRVSVWLGLRVLSGADRPIGAALRTAAQTHCLRITYHAAENRADVDAVRSRYQLGAAEYARSLSLLGDDVVIAHGVHVGPDDLRILAETGTGIAHCPSSNARTGSGVAPVTEYLRQGVTVGLGTDGGMVNDGYDLMAEMRLSAMLHNAGAGSGVALRPEQVVEMATRHGSRMLGLASGSVETGSNADLVVLDLHRLGSWPTGNPVDSLVYAADRSCVWSVLVGGRSLVRDGRLIDVDEAALLRDAAEVAAETVLAAGLAGVVGPDWPVHPKSRGR